MSLKQEHMTGSALDNNWMHIWQTEAWRAAKGCAYNGLTSTHPGVCCFPNKKICERKCIRTAKLIALNPPGQQFPFNISQGAGGYRETGL